jgi:hypothetical protein
VTKDQKKIIRVVPSEPGSLGYQVTAGTKVFVGDTEINGVTKIELIGDINDLWRARISCLVQAPNITALADVDMRTAPTRWQRFLQWLRCGDIHRIAARYRNQ